MKNRRFKLIVVLTCILFLALIGYYFYSRNLHVMMRPAAYSLNSEELYTEYFIDKETANIKYKSKVIEVTGIVQEVYSKKGNCLKIILRNKDIYNGVSCIIENSDVQIITPLKLGSSVTLKGYCEGIDSDVMLLKCILVRS